MLSALKGVAQKAWEFRQVDDHKFNVIKSIKGARGSRVIKGRALNAIESSRLIYGCENEKTVKGIRDAAIFALGVGLACAETSWPRYVAPKSIFKSTPSD